MQVELLISIICDRVDFIISSYVLINIRLKNQPLHKTAYILFEFCQKFSPIKVVTIDNEYPGGLLWSYFWGRTVSRVSVKYHFIFSRFELKIPENTPLKQIENRF